ncbi:MAG: excinuclease ABC subunit A [Candidatus Wallbacteria bacterium GWC2_49_35]|uniref:UvrABC system protein A n=1 Tax=Candidatus Wallbacteria bacterium GWC2_49_35 TaxID=1817813 RepID=A0A1F7WGY1_9BACT|nr:MAG: excinuclease ABC subunit A [Candidatus Wallbacteria bacterium GWC2_49_35]
MDSRDSIIIKGARQHNLKNISVEIPRNKFVVITGLSGSGKSTLAFDTLYAEGQRRYIESLSSYARQFLGRMDKPDVDSIDGLSPAISIAQKSISHNPRSTVGTVTEIYDYMRLLYARIGQAHCPECKIPIQKQTVQDIVDKVMSYTQGTKIRILAPIVRARKGQFQDMLVKVKKSGFTRVRIDSIEYEEDFVNVNLDKNKKHSVEVIIDRLVVKPEIGNRLPASIETALKLGEGIVIIDRIGDKEEIYSEHYACTKCGFSLSEIEPRIFSFNSPQGACTQCHGLGSKMEIDPNLLIPDKNKKIKDGAIAPFKGQSNFFWKMLSQVAEHYKFSLESSWNKLNSEQQDILLYGTGDEDIRFNMTFGNNSSYTYNKPYEGIIPLLERRYEQSQSESVKAEIMSYMSMIKCPACAGKRLKKEILSILIKDMSITDVASMSIKEARNFYAKLGLNARQAQIAKEILKEITSRLEFLTYVGLDYLSLDRAASTLSGGESQRINLACQIGSGLVGVLYILDEPSIGLHQRDNEKLLKTLEHLRDLNNTLVVVEHDEQTILSADYVIDMGPGAGEYGGSIVYEGTPASMLKSGDSLTAKYLRKDLEIKVPAKRREIKGGNKIEIKGARENNLKNIDVAIPLGKLTCVTGVSGSGKSTLINEILYKHLMKHFYATRIKTGECDEIKGLEKIDKVIDIDQSPIGRTPRSNPATYINVFNNIRELFALTAEARARGYTSSRFSFNVKGGRCEACEGDGIIRIEMQFLSDVYIECEQCRGTRYNRETLEIRYKGKSISEVLASPVDEMVDFFSSIPQIHRKIKSLQDVGLGYIRLGQSSTTLSGGEAQRIKLACELAKVSTGNTLYLLDEPTTGLHFADIHRLIEVLGRLVDMGNSVVVIEHNLDVIKMADHIIDLGPEGGNEGGQVVASCSPEELVNVKNSYTGQFLKKYIAALPSERKLKKSKGKA